MRIICSNFVLLLGTQEEREMVHYGQSLGAVMRPDAASHWLGQSGRDYALTPEHLDSFVMSDADLTVIAKGHHVLWVGSSQDLVADPVSRVRFRLAMDGATSVYRLPAPADRLFTLFDLQEAIPAPGRIAQAA